jgi:hypothetical protein
LAQPSSRWLTVGTAVRVTSSDPDEFRRVPSYLRGCTGEVVALCGEWRHPVVRRGAPAPDSLSDREREPVFTVAFALSDVFGEQCGSAKVYADLWLRYLEPV